MNNFDATRLPSAIEDLQEPVFAEPWQAEVFALVLSLHEQGVFTWPEWTEQLSQVIRSAAEHGDPDLGDTYYLHWLTALENMVERKGIASSSHLAELHDAWENAALRTPHGQPITLAATDFSKSRQGH